MADSTPFYIDNETPWEDLGDGLSLLGLFPDWIGDLVNGTRP
ncbi:hypothetical protein [Daejeonella sp.]